jgi:hypothetical protein
MKLNWPETQLPIITLRYRGLRWGDYDSMNPTQNAKRHTESACALARRNWKSLFRAVAHPQDQPGSSPFKRRFNGCTTSTANGFRPSPSHFMTRIRHNDFKRPSNNWKPFLISFQKSNCHEALGGTELRLSALLVASLRPSPLAPAVLGGSLAAAPGARIACRVKELRAPGSKTARGGALLAASAASLKIML